MEGPSPVQSGPWNRLCRATGAAAPSGGSEPREAGSVGVRILLVKLSSLGDVVHALPVVQDLLAALPGAQIDWVVEQSFAPVLALHHGVRRIIPCEIRRWRKSPLSAATRQQWNAFKADLRQTEYDAIIDLQGLTKSAVVAWLARLAPGGKRYALGNQTDGSGYEAPTRWVADVAIRTQPHIHAVQRSRELAARALGYSLAPSPDYGLKRQLAQSGWTHSATEKIANRVAFVHGTSRADKEWPLDHWTALGHRLNAAGYQVALAHGNEKEKLKSQAIARVLNESAPGHAVALPLLPLDALTHELAQCAGVIGVDSGVSHIAVALDLPHVQLYNFDTAWRTGPDAASGRQVSVYAAPAPGVDQVWQAWLGCLDTVQGAQERPSQVLEWSSCETDGA
ncbi:Lipopolysaccharide heptosyltransferase I [Polaromonas sp. CG9_12]|nr:Lipopolysaccharide heptosyltransferase I [Polaromonas sp. CG9_12]